MTEENLKMAYDKRGRYYYLPSNPNKKMYSVTTLLHWGQPKSKPSDSTKIGTICHYHILRRLAKEHIEVPTECPYWIHWQEVDRRIEDALCMWGQLEFDKVVEDWLFVETAVVFEGKIDGLDIGYAGRIDAIAKFKDGKIRLVDLKTGDEYEDYPLQMAGYTQAIEYSLGIHIDECYICYLDVGENYVKEVDTSFKRNPHRVARIVTYNREELDKYIKIFNEKLIEIVKECV